MPSIAAEAICSFAGVAGNFANDDTVASMEYTVAMLNTPFDHGAGHDSLRRRRRHHQIAQGQRPPCRVICPLWSPASRPRPFKAVSGQPGNSLDNAIRQNVRDNVAKLQIRDTPHSQAAAVEQGKLKVVGGIYRLKDGRVENDCMRRVFVRALDRRVESWGMPWEILIRRPRAKTRGPITTDVREARWKAPRIIATPWWLWVPAQGRDDTNCCRGSHSLSTIVTLAMPPPSHMVCRPVNACCAASAH